MGKIIRPNHIVFVIKLLSYLDKYFCSSKTARRVKKYFDKHSHKICSEVRINKKHEPSTVTNYNGSWGVRTKTLQKCYFVLKIVVNLSYQ